jgi:hypothetical protein
MHSDMISCKTRWALYERADVAIGCISIAVCVYVSLVDAHCLYEGMDRADSRHLSP